MSTGLRINAKKSPTYAEFVAQEIERLGLPQDAYHLPSVALTLEEKERLDATSFSEELQFTAPVNLSDSKTAFKNLLLGLNSPSDFVGLWSFKPFDPNNVPNPMSGDIGVSSLLAQPPIKR
eukprot:Em0010g89a